MTARTELTAEYELIYSDGTLSTTRYLPIPDDLPEDEIRDWVADRIVPQAEESGCDEWIQRILTTNDSARRAVARADEVRREWARNHRVSS